MKKFLICFLAGLVLVGVGSGVAVAEWSSLTFKGEKEIRPETELQKWGTFEMYAPEGERHTIKTALQVESIQEDPLLDPGTIHIEYWGYSYMSFHANNENDRLTYVYGYASRESWPLIQELMEDLKKHEIYREYHFAEEGRIRITLSPDLVGKLDVKKM